MTYADLIPELEELAESVQRLAEAEFAPLVEAAERDERFPREVIRRMGEVGLLASEHPDDPNRPYRLAESVIIEQLARVSAGFATSVIVQISVIPGLLREFAGAEHRARWLEPMGRGELIGSLCVTEPDAGRHQGHPGASGAAAGWLGDHRLEALRHERDARRLLRRRRSRRLLRRARGHRALRGRARARSRGRHPEDGEASVRSSDTAWISFDGVDVPEDALLGGDLDGFAKLMSTFDAERVIHASRALGLSRAAFDAARRYAGERHQFGRAIERFQAVAFKLADMDVAIEASTMLIRRAAALADDGRPFHREASIAKLFATEAARNIATESMQIHGSYGLTAEFPVGRFVADAHLETIGTGTSEIQRILIARELAGRGVHA